MALFQKLPIMLSKYVRPESKPWKLLLMLQEIVKILCAPELNETMLNYFSLLYEEYLNLFIKYYPNVSIRESSSLNSFSDFLSEIMFVPIFSHNTNTMKRGQNLSPQHLLLGRSSFF